MKPSSRGLVIVPAFNEEAVIGATLTRVEELALDADVLVVDDGSSDRTAAIARHHRARLLRLPFNLGIGGALRTGFRYACTHSYPWAVQLDADGQHDPEQIELLLEHLAGGADLVVGSRFAKGSGAYDVGRTRRGAMGVLGLAMKVLVGRTFTDTSSGFRAFSTRALDYFSHNYPAEYMESVEALLLASYAGLRIVEVPVTMRARQGGSPSNRRWRLLYHYARLFVVLVSSASLRRRIELREADR